MHTHMCAHRCTHAHIGAYIDMLICSYSLVSTYAHIWLCTHVKLGQNAVCTRYVPKVAISAWSDPEHLCAHIGAHIGDIGQSEYVP